MNIRTHLTLRPRTPAGQALLEISRRLRRITTADEAVVWLQQLNDWHTTYGHLTQERSYAKRRFTDGSWDSPTGLLRVWLSPRPHSWEAVLKG